VHLLLSDLVLQLLRSTFYVTEVDGLGTHALCFFRRPVWAQLRAEALDTLVDGRFFRRLGVGQEEERQVLRTMAGPGTLGVSRLRYSIAHTIVQQGMTASSRPDSSQGVGTEAVSLYLHTRDHLRPVRYVVYGVSKCVRVLVM
jgi:hypothetical protein